VSANINAIFQGILTIADETQSNAPYITNLDLENPTLAATQVLNQQFVQVATSPGTTISFSFNAFLVLVWNRSLTASLQVNLNPTGGTINEVGILGPGGVMVLMDPAKANGWDGLALISGSGTIPATVVLAG
jgi:hypothetical protein